eukprot:6209595-Pleurochrysis_carterae.AAC.7
MSALRHRVVNDLPLGLMPSPRTATLATSIRRPPPNYANVERLPPWILLTAYFPTSLQIFS